MTLSNSMSPNASESAVNRISQPSPGYPGNSHTNNHVQSHQELISPQLENLLTKEPKTGSNSKIYKAGSGSGSPMNSNSNIDKHSHKDKWGSSTGLQILTKLHLKKHDDCETVYTTSLNDYELLRDIGGVEDISFLYLAKHTPTGKTVTLKLTDLSLSMDYEFIDEVIRTVRNGKLLSHHHILTPYLSFVEEDQLWTVTPPVHAGSIRGLIKDQFSDGLNENVTATILKDVLKALLYIHENHMIHNDIRADNILIDIKGEVKLSGFRQLIVLQQGGRVNKTAFSLVGDNLEWAAPEVITQNTNYTSSADIYSIGITAMELAFGKTPFDNWPPLKILLCKTSYECPAMKSPKTFSKHFYQFLQACLAKTPDDRPTVSECLAHPFIKQAKNSSYLEHAIIRKITKSPLNSTTSPASYTNSREGSAKSPTGDKYNVDDQFEGLENFVKHHSIERLDG
ncbi:hypothetical protein HDV06_006840 [Boothiomyces sp. JEL0866]|nr:hypothetical protein HDV06_006840 [Boothiomyces sp. JEL0866]